MAPPRLISGTLPGQVSVTKFVRIPDEPPQTFEEMAALVIAVVSQDNEFRNRIGGVLGFIYQIVSEAAGASGTAGTLRNLTYFPVEIAVAVAEWSASVGAPISDLGKSELVGLSQWIADQACSGLAEQAASVINDANIPGVTATDQTRKRWGFIDHVTVMVTWEHDDPEQGSVVENWSFDWHATLNLDTPEIMPIEDWGPQIDAILGEPQGYHDLIYLVAAVVMQKPVYKRINDGWAAILAFLTNYVNDQPVDYSLSCQADLDTTQDTWAGIANDVCAALNETTFNVTATPITRERWFTESAVLVDHPNAGEWVFDWHPTGIPTHPRVVGKDQWLGEIEGEVYESMLDEDLHEAMCRVLCLAELDLTNCNIPLVLAGGGGPGTGEAVAPSAPSGAPLDNLWAIHQDAGDMDCGPAVATFLRHGGFPAANETPFEGSNPLTIAMVDQIADRMRRETSAPDSHAKGTTAPQLLAVLNEYATLLDDEFREWTSQPPLDAPATYTFSVQPGTRFSTQYQWPATDFSGFRLGDDSSWFEQTRDDYISRIEQELAMSPYGVVVLLQLGTTPDPLKLHWVVVVEVDGDQVRVFNPMPSASGQDEWHTADNLFTRHMVAMCGQRTQILQAIASDLTQTEPGQVHFFAYMLGAQDHPTADKLKQMRLVSRLILTFDDDTALERYVRATQDAAYTNNVESADMLAKMIAEDLGQIALVLEERPGVFAVVTTDLSVSSLEAFQPESEDDLEPAGSYAETSPSGLPNFVSAAYFFKPSGAEEAQRFVRFPTDSSESHRTIPGG